MKTINKDIDKTDTSGPAEYLHRIYKQSRQERERVHSIKSERENTASPHQQQKD